MGVAQCKPCAATEEKNADDTDLRQVAQDEPISFLKPAEKNIVPEAVETLVKEKIPESAKKEMAPQGAHNLVDHVAWKARLAHLSQQVTEEEEESDEDDFASVARSSVIQATMKTLGKTQDAGSMISSKNLKQSSINKVGGGCASEMEQLREEDEGESDREAREDQLKKEMARERELDGRRGGRKDDVQPVVPKSDVTSGSAEAEVEVNEDALLRRPRRLSATTVKLINTMGRETSSRLQLIIENPRSLDTFYDIRSHLGEGSYGTVKKACVRGTGALRAVKSINKARMIDLSANHSFDRLKAELAITKQIDHPNVIKLYEIFEDTTEIHLIMELCWGGDLLDRIKRHEHFTELQTHHVMMQVLRATFYLHNNDIVHRDMKPQNILVVTKDNIEKANIKISDFGMATKLKPGVKFTAQVGTLPFMAPEVLGENYSELCDVWSCGVIMYMCLCGYLPFRGKHRSETRQKILKKKVAFKMEHWYHCSNDVMDLVHHLLRKVPHERLSAKEALQSKWMQRYQKSTTTLKLQRDLVNRLLTFRGLNKFKRATLQLIVSLLNEKQTGELCEAFMALDVDGDGFLDVNELKDRLENESQVVKIFQDDDQKDGTLVDYSFTEFLAATFDRERYVQQDVCKAAFTVFDQDGSGDITISELSNGRLLGYLSTNELQKLIQDLDQNGDGKIDFEEFVLMMRARDNLDAAGEKSSTSPKFKRACSFRTLVTRPTTRRLPSKEPRPMGFHMDESDAEVTEPCKSGSPASTRLSAATTCDPESDFSPNESTVEAQGRNGAVPSKCGNRTQGLRGSAVRGTSEAAALGKAASPMKENPTFANVATERSSGAARGATKPKSRQPRLPTPKSPPAPAASAPAVEQNSSAKAPMKISKLTGPSVDATITNKASTLVNKQGSTSAARTNIKKHPTKNR